MSFLSLAGVELKKTRRSGILWILVIPVFLIWLTAVINADINFTIGNEGISPENNFFIQSFMGYAWFMFPASIVISTVMLVQTERKNKGILKMLALPVSAARLCLVKFSILLLLAAVQMFFMTLAYFPSAAIASRIQDYNFMLPVMDILREAGIIYISSIPMAAFFWMLAVSIQTPIFPWVWEWHLLCRPSFLLTQKYGLRTPCATRFSWLHPGCMSWHPIWGPLLLN